MNRSKQRTNIFIYHQFARLLQKYPYTQITVIDIVQASMIHRNTFYHHFEDKTNLLKKGFEYFFKTEKVDQKESLASFVQGLARHPFYTLNNFYKTFYPVYFKAQMNDRSFNIVIYRIFKRYLIRQTHGAILWILGRIDAVIVWNRYEHNYYDIYQNSHSGPQCLDRIYQRRQFPRI